MNADLQQIQQAAEGLFFLSESDYPFEVVHFNLEGPIEDHLLRLADKGVGTLIEQTTVEYFLRNMTSIDTGAEKEQQAVAGRFKILQNTLIAKLIDLKVWRIGTIQIDAFIVGKLKDGTYGGLRTKSIET